MKACHWAKVLGALYGSLSLAVVVLYLGTVSGCDGGVEVGGGGNAYPQDGEDAGPDKPYETEIEVGSLAQGLIPRYCAPGPYVYMINAARESIGDVTGLRCQVLSGRNNDFVCDYPAGEANPPSGSAYPASQYLLTEIAQTSFSASGKWYVHTEGIEEPGEWSKRWRYVCSCSGCYVRSF